MNPATTIDKEQQEELDALHAAAGAGEGAGASVMSGDVIAQEKKRDTMEPNPQTVMMLLPVIGLICRSVVPNWGITQDEQEALAGCYALVLEKYFTELDLGVELSAVIVTAAIIMPRLDRPRKVEDKDNKNDEKQGQGQQADQKKGA